MELEGLSAVILAAGKGTRMRSRFNKVLHPVLGEPMIFHSLRAVTGLGIPPERTVIVVGHGADEVRRVVAERGPYLFAEQTEQLGTGHALAMAAPALESLPPGEAEQILVFYGDCPLYQPSTLARLVQTHLVQSPLLTLATAFVADPTGYGRIVRASDTQAFQAIIEEVDLLPAQKTIKESNVGLYLYRAKWLWPALKRLRPSPKGEFYLTDLAAFAAENELGVATLEVEAQESLSINDRVQLAQVSALLRQRILRHWMLAGVTLTDPASTFISAASQIEPDTLIEPNTHLRGACRIGPDCVIGPNTLLTDATLGAGCQIIASVIENSTLEAGVKVGPFSRVRPGSYLEENVRLGNFAEVSRSRIGAGSRQGHFSFIGDATLGPDVNIGAGTITANYDGVDKHKTQIGAHAFIGSDTILRAPISLGDYARTGAGSVVTRNVEEGVTVVGLPARPIKRRTQAARPAAGAENQNEAAGSGGVGDDTKHHPPQGQFGTDDSEG